MLPFLRKKSHVTRSGFLQNLFLILMPEIPGALSRRVVTPGNLSSIHQIMSDSFADIEGRIRAGGRRAAFVLVLFLACLGGGTVVAPAQSPPTTPNLIDGGDMIDFSTQVNPWAGLDLDGDLHGISADQLAVDDSGSIRSVLFSPSVAVGDLNGDGLLDLLVADPKGFIWYYPNSGTKTNPKFTTGEVTNLWLGSTPLSNEEHDALPELAKQSYVVDHLVPRIQLVDLTGSGKLDLVAGTFPGLLYYIHNIGTRTQPIWDMPLDPDSLRKIPTTSNGLLDCNFFSPFLYDFSKTGRLDLLRGEGTYAANSIVYYLNKGKNDDPAFSKPNQTLAIPGVGREHLVPQVVDWNNNGKPDVITGERTGSIDLFLNTSTGSGPPTFEAGQHVKIGGQETFGNFTTVTPAPLTGDPAKPDLIMTNDSGKIFLCRNTGKPGAPAFASPPQPIKGGPNPFPPIEVPDKWALGSWDSFAPHPLHGWAEGPPYGVPYELLVITNARQEPGFSPPNGVTWKNALRYEALTPKNTYFPVHYYPKLENEQQQHSVCYTGNFPMKSETHYMLSFWVKGDGVHDVAYEIHGGQYAHPGKDDGTIIWIEIRNPIPVNSTWTQFQDDVSWYSQNGVRHESDNLGLALHFFGQGNLYIADVQLHESK
jgi:hypothetical protein